MQEEPCEYSKLWSLCLIDTQTKCIIWKKLTSDCIGIAEQDIEPSASLAVQIPALLSLAHRHEQLVSALFSQIGSVPSCLANCASLLIPTVLPNEWTIWTYTSYAGEEVAVLVVAV